MGWEHVGAGLSLQVTSTMNFIKGGSIEGQPLGPEREEIDIDSEISHKKIIRYQVSFDISGLAWDLCVIFR